jgi:hypothetical protein
MSALYYVISEKKNPDRDRIGLDEVGSYGGG